MPNVPTKLPRYRHLPAVPGNPPKTARGLFGASDNVGMFKLQTPDIVVAAAKLVRKGAVFAMNWEEEKPNPPLFGRGKSVTRCSAKFRSAIMATTSSTTSSRRHRVSGTASRTWATASTASGAVCATKSCATATTNRDSASITGRAELLDVAGCRAAQGRPIDCDASDVISVADLEGTVRAQRVELKTGDVWIIYLGWIEWYEQQTPQKKQQLAITAMLKTPGLECSEAMAEWIFDRYPAALCCDNPALESWPPPNFMDPQGFLRHWIIGRFGMAIGEMFQPTALAADCAQDNVYEGLFVSAPLNFTGGTGSLPNARVIK